MIKEKIIDIKVGNNTLRFYKNKFDNIKIGDNIKINIEDLPFGSHNIITAVCDNCGKEKNMEYRTYLKNTNNNKIDYHCKNCSTIRIQETLFKKYGHNHALQCDEFKNKASDTLFDNYGVRHPIASDKIRKKFNKTMIKKYGVKNALENEKILSKLKDKTFRKYGMYYVETDEFKNKSKITCLEKYGAECATGDLDVQLKRMKTCLEKYGVTHHFQNKEILDKSLISGLKMKKYKDTSLYYQGTYEKDFLDLCDKLNILDKIKRGCSVKYFMDDKNLIYFPDFHIENKNLLIEIKSLYWYNKHKNRNILKENKCKELGFNYLLIMNKNYDKFLKLI